MAFLPRVSATLSSQLLSTTVRRNAPAARFFHASPLKAAIAHPITAHGPPPKAPAPAPELQQQEKQKQQEQEQQEQQRQQEEEEAKLAKTAKEDKVPPTKPSGLKRRFWRNVDVQKKQEEYQVLLDTRPVRTPTKDVLSIPPSKPHLAHAIALEWDVMTSAQQALRYHLIPLTSLTARAADIAQEDAAGVTTTREQIVKTTIRYLDTDTLLCWVPEQDVYSPPEVDENGQKKESLRDVQVKVAKDIISYLNTKVWPGIEIKPVLDEGSIIPASQPQATKDIIKSWISNLQAHDLAGFERGVLGSKSLLVAARLVAEWSENFRGSQRSEQKKFGIEEATEASSLEVRWQTDMWGEVEDTHDVDKEDVKRQLGSVIVLVSGETR